MAQTEQEGALRTIALRKQRLGRVHDTDQLVLDVQVAAAPDKAVGDHPLERRMGPLSRGGGHDILVRHQHGRLQVGRLPCQV